MSRTKRALPDAVRLPHNGDVFPLLRSRPLIWIALFAWIAQLCLPTAHAAVMAQQDAGMAAWCGVESPALQAKLAALPDEVREILEKGNAQAEQHAECLSLCANAGGASLPPVSPSVALRAAGLESRVAPAVPAPRQAPTLAPPVRGLPLNV